LSSARTGLSTNISSCAASKTSWTEVTEWHYSYNVYPEVHVDARGNALVLMFFEPPMSMPCFGDLWFNGWVTEDGKVLPLPKAPSAPTAECSEPQGGGYGFPLAVDDGFAFYSSDSGWWTRFRSGATTSDAPPAWLSGHDENLHALATGAYLSVQHDPTTCARTAELIGPAGQVCARVTLDGSADCKADDLVTRDGTLILQNYSCSVAWWPGLARPR
jgi:hypothetical protein